MIDTPNAYRRYRKSHTIPSYLWRNIKFDINRGSIHWRTMTFPVRRSINWFRTWRFRCFVTCFRRALSEWCPEFDIEWIIELSHRRDVICEEDFRSSLKSSNGISMEFKGRITCHARWAAFTSSWGTRPILVSNNQRPFVAECYFLLITVCTNRIEWNY